MKTFFNYGFLSLFLSGYYIPSIAASKEFVFDSYPDKMLSLPIGVMNVTQMSTKVADKIDCVFSCTREQWCRSMNFKLQAENDDLHICELVSASSHENQEHLVVANGYTHLGLENKCIDQSLCQNNGSCLPDYYNANGYRCICNGTTGRNCEMFYRDCSEVLSAGYTTAGVYRIDPGGHGSYPVYCDGNGWTVFQRNRKNSYVSFNRGWQQYKTGFGNLNGEFWLGLDKIYRLTRRGTTSLRVDLEDMNGNTRYAVYSSFSIADESDLYRLVVSGYSGTAGDAIVSGPTNPAWVNNNARFSTPDRDNDEQPGGNCARTKGWWMRWCTNSDLNGEMTWWTFNKVLKNTQMKLK